MRVVISSGHSEDVRGASGYIDEVDEARLVVEEVANFLRSAQNEVITFHDNVSQSQGENLDRIVDFHNSKSRDLDVSVHFNAYETTSKPMGCEVLYVSSSGERIANEIVDAICSVSGLINRGPKFRDNLAFLNGTHETAVLIEVCFVDSKADVDLYHKYYGDICMAIAGAIAGEEITAPSPPEPVEPPTPTLPPISSMRTLRKGMSGEDVATMQRILGLPPDGIFGEITETQVEAFQASCDLVSDGIVGPMTWEELNELNRRKNEGSIGLTDELVREITEVAQASPLMGYHWPSRGIAPKGYIPGMALCFAVALMRYHDGDDGASIMAQATGSPEVDALAWYKEEFEELDMYNEISSADTLRHLFVMLIGLGMRESSGRYCEGRDMSASNVEAVTAEAALFQTSWNIETCHPSEGKLLDEYWENPNGFLEEFRVGISPDASDLDCYGSGDGATYQWLAKYCPLFAVLTTAVGLRVRRQHWGPVNRKEVTLKTEADVLLRRVQGLIEGA